MFAERGFAGTTTRQIADAVGTSETVLFRHFSSKEVLYTAILEQRLPPTHIEGILEELRAIADRRDDSALFVAVVRGILDSFRLDPVFHRLNLFASLEDHDLARLGQVRNSAPVASFLREYISRRQAEGAFQRLRPEIVVHMLIATATHYALWNALGMNPLGLSDEEVASGAVALLNGIREDN